MRYKIFMRLDNGEPIVLEGAHLPAARTLANGMSHPDDRYPYWEIIDTYSGNVVMSSDTKNEKRK